MAMLVPLRKTASRAWQCRLGAADAVSRFPLGCQSDLTSSTIVSSSSSSVATAMLQSPRFSSSMPSSRSVSELLKSFSTSPSFPLSVSGALQIPPFRPSFSISAPSVAPLCSFFAGLHSSTGNALAGLRLGSAYRDAQQLVSDSPAPSASMQQRRNLSKLKAYKMKAYSSYRERFKLMADGTYKRWRSGTRHNAHSKTAKQRRQLRKPSTAPPALAKVMKKLNFVR